MGHKRTNHARSTGLTTPTDWFFGLTFFGYCCAYELELEVEGGVDSLCEVTGHCVLVRRPH